MSRESIAFYGASDDLIEVEGKVPGCDEYNSEREVFVVAGLRVAVEYGARGVWGIGVEQVDESVPIGAADLKLGVQPRMDGSPGYSMRLDMSVPAGTVVVCESAHHRSDA